MEAVVLNLWQTVCAFSADGGTCAHAFPLPDTPLHTKVTFRKIMVIESRNTWFVAEHLEQILKGRVPCNVCGSDGLCCVLHCVLLCAMKDRDKKSIDGMAENQRVLALNRHDFSEGHFRV